MIEEISAERIGEVRKVREKVVGKLPEEKKRDRGLIRLRVAKKMMGKEPEVVERALRRYVDLHLGENREIKGHIEAIHAPRVTTGALVEPLRRKRKELQEEFPDVEVPEMEPGKVMALSQWMEGLIQKYLEEHPGSYRSDATEYLREFFTDKEMLEALKVTDKYDELTGQVAQKTAEGLGASWLQAKKPRIIADINRPAGTRETQAAIVTLEDAFGVREAYWEALRRVFENADLLDEEGKLISPWLQLSVHGMKPRDEEIVIGGGMKGGRLPFEPVVGQWLKERLEKKIKEERILGTDGKRLARVKIALEGEVFSGAVVNPEYRFGDGKSHLGFGELLQVFQLEMCQSVRRKPDKLSNALAEILKEFSDEFPTEEALRDYKEVGIKKAAGA